MHALILLIGSNPLPNYLAACVLRPDAVKLVYTRETKDSKDRLASTLARVLGAHIQVTEQHVADATSATEVALTIENLMKEAGEPDQTWLSYTGGTKVMAAHSRMAFQRAGGRDDHALYLGESSRIDGDSRLRFDNGTSQSLSAAGGVQLDLETLLELHGLIYTPRSSTSGCPTADDALEMAKRALAEEALPGRLYELRQRFERTTLAEAAADPFCAYDFDLKLSQPVIPSCEMTKAAFKRWYKFLGGEWLEEWLAGQIEALLLQPAPQITAGVNARRGPLAAPLELDVAVIRGPRSYFVSCTTDAKKKLCKAKLFEVAVRSRQLGGDLARGALLCLAADATSAALQREIDDVWGASNSTRVFGLSDACAWAGVGGAPNRYSLEQWLNS